MSETWRRVLVGSAIVVAGLGLLEVVLSRTPMEPSSAAVTRGADNPGDPWRDYVDADGRVLRVDIDAASEPTAPATR